MTRSKKTHGWNGYLDWAATTAGAYSSTAANLWEPVFVRSIDNDVSTQDFFDSVVAQSDYLFDPFEQTYNALYRKAGAPVEALLLRKHKKSRARRGFDARIEVLHVGALGPRNAMTLSQPNFAEHSNSDPVAIGIIDDGIAYLHPNFRNAQGNTRFAGFLMQTLPHQGTSNSGHAGWGHALNSADINASIAQLSIASEDELYRAQTSAVYAPLTRHGLRHLASHGTHMLDLAAGVDLLALDDAGMRDVPILAVQLPPEAFEDTSGVRMQTHIIQGLRWMIYRAFAENLIDELVVNISLGVVAGPKNGRSFLEQQIQREIERIALHYSGAKTLELVFAYGNAYEDGLVARMPLAAGERSSIHLCLQPDDRTPSFVELRLSDLSTEAKSKHIEVTLTAPDGTTETKTLRKGRHATLFGTEDAPIARLYHTPARDLWGGKKEPAYLTLAFAPTGATKSNDVLAPSGQWKFECRNVTTKVMDLTIQVQRDDSPFSRSTGARQAYLSDDRARGWSAKNRDFSALEATSILTHEGSNSAFATVKHDNVHSVGAARVRPAGIEPAQYTAQGADWSGAAPSACAIAQIGHAGSGVLAAGTFASSSARLSGTSAAAASYTRHMVKPETTVPVDADFDRLGAVTVTHNPAIRD